MFRTSLFILISIFLKSSFLFGADKLEVLNIVMLFDEHIKEQAKDIKQMSEDGIADIHLVSFFIVPEGNPPIDKISIFEKKFKRLKKEINDKNCKVGIVLQSTLGHGFELEEPLAFQHLVSADKKLDNTAKNIACPLDKDFQSYILDCVRRAVALNPEIIMIDDDFRLFGGRQACICPLHLQKLKTDFGYDITKEQAIKHLNGNSEKDKKISDALTQVASNSLYELAAKIRLAIDAVNPMLECVLCANPQEMRHTKKIASLLAGKYHPIVVRIGNARYHTKNLSTLYYSAQQTAQHSTSIGKINKVYAELDTFPRNRYATNASVLHAQFILSILEGCCGAKFWPNRFPEFEPESGDAYKKIFKNNRKFYDAIFALTKESSSRGIANFIDTIPPSMRRDSNQSQATWANCIGVMGIPLAFSDSLNVPLFVRGDAIKKLTDKQILEMLHNNLVLDSNAAVEIQKRGLQKYIGVDVLPFEGKKISREKLTPFFKEIQGKWMETGINHVLLKPNSENVEVISEFMHIPYSYADKSLGESISPACTLFKNDFDGKIVVFASEPEGQYYKNQTRKKMLTNIADLFDKSQIFYNSDEEVLVKQRTTFDGKTLLALFNVGLDNIEEINLLVNDKISSLHMLQNDGSWRIYGFEQIDNKVKIRAPLETYMPIVLRITK